MNSMANFEDLDLAIEALIAGAEIDLSTYDPQVVELVQIARELQQLPRPDFKMRLKTELDWFASSRPLSSAAQSQAEEKGDIVPSLLGNGCETYPVQRIHFVASAALHAIALAFILALGILAVKGKPKQNVAVSYHLSILSEYIPPAATRKPHGGGGGGEAEKTNASHGALPKTAAQQLTPPVVVIRNSDPKLPAEPTIIAPNLQVPRSNQMGDPLSTLMNPSSGVGVRGGIGSGTGGGIGSGYGPGYGIGAGGNVGDSLYQPGIGITAPRPIYDPDPEYSPEARAAKYEGTVILHAIVAPDGHPHAVQVARSLGMGLDEKAVEAVNTWRFEPGKKDGHPVPVMVEIYVSFHLY